MAFQQSVAVRNACGDARTAQIGNAGKLRIYDNTAGVPANVAAAALGNLLSEHILGSPFAPAASGGTVSPTLPANVNAGVSGTALYYRVYKADGTSCVQQDGVVSSGNGLILNPSNNAIVSGQPVQVDSWSIVEGGA